MFGLFKKQLPDKDPKDYTKTPSSTGWQLDSHFCNKCLKSTGHSEFMSGVCNGCGGFETQWSKGRSYRQIIQNGKWVYQIRYEKGNEEIRDGWYI